jgi:hypothetical protein
MTLSHYPGDVKDFKMLTAEGLDREGLILKVNNDTPSDPRMTKITASGDTIFGVGFTDTKGQDGVVDTGGQCSVVQEGEAMVAVKAATYSVGNAIYLSDDTDGTGDNTSAGSKVGVCQEYKVVTSAMVTAGTNQVRTRLTFIT